MTDEPQSDFHRTYIRLDEVGSTNDVVRGMLMAGATALPVVVEADRQTAGRGRESRSWWSDAGSLTFSVGLDPDQFGLRREQVPRVTLASAVALIDVLELAGVPSGRIGIRWPNDLEAGGRKLAGILPEWVETPDGGRLVVGIGLNVTTDLEAASEAIREMATTVATLSPLDRPEKRPILEAFLGRLGPTLKDLGREDPGLAARWSTLDTLRGVDVRVDVAGRIVAGRGAGITPTGGLRLEVTPARPGVDDTIVLHGGRVLRPPPRRPDECHDPGESPGSR